MCGDDGRSVRERRRRRIWRAVCQSAIQYCGSGHPASDFSAALPVSQLVAEEAADRLAFVDPVHSLHEQRSNRQDNHVGQSAPRQQRHGVGRDDFGDVRLLLEPFDRRPVNSP